LPRAASADEWAGTGPAGVGTLALAAADQTKARERVLELCRTTIAGLTHPPTVAAFAPEHWLTR
jgi:hypothetical protein